MKVPALMPTLFLAAITFGCSVVFAQDASTVQSFEPTWESFGEGPAIIPEGHLADLKFKGFSAEDVRFTRSKDGKTLYVICLDRPESGNVSVKTLGINADLLEQTPVSVTMPGSDAKITWTRDAAAMTISLPDELPCDHVYVFRVELW